VDAGASADKLVKSLGKEVALKLVDRFVADRGTALAQIDRAVDAGDLKGVRTAAHALRGVSSMLGLPEVARHGSLLEAAARAPGASTEWPTHRHNVSAALDEACGQLEAWLRAQRGG